jgi:hypothetical protein
MHGLRAATLYLWAPTDEVDGQDGWQRLSRQDFGPDRFVRFLCPRGHAWMTICSALKTYSSDSIAEAQLLWVWLRPVCQFVQFLVRQVLKIHEKLRAGSC